MVLLKKSLMAAILVAISILGVYAIIDNMPLKKYDDLVESLKKELKEKYKKVSSSKLKSDKQYKYSYTKGTVFYVNGSEDFAVSVVEYKSNYEAEAKKKYIADANETAHKLLDNTVAATFDSYKYIFSDYTIIVKGKYLFSIDPNLKNKEDIIKYIDKIIKKYDTKDTAKYNKKKVDNYWKEQLKLFKQAIQDYYDGTLNLVRESISLAEDDLYSCEEDECEEMLNEVLEYEKFEELSDVVEHFKDTYYEIIG